MGDDDEMGSLFVNSFILTPKNDYVKTVTDARYLNLLTQRTKYSWPLEPVQMIMTRLNGKAFSVSNLSCAYHKVPLSPATKKTNQVYDWWETVHLNTWFLWVVRTPKLH